VLTQSEENWFSRHGRAAAPKGQLLTKGFDQAFPVGAGFTVAAAILAAVLISSRDGRQPSKAARSGGAPGTDDADVPAIAGLALQSIWCS
jgi:hypothetical protein